MAKILFLNRIFGPGTEATGVLLSELSEDLAREHEVTVVCAATAGQHRKSVEENSGRVRVIRTWSPNISKLRAMLRYLNFVAYFLLAACAAIRESPDVVVVETDPPILGALGAMLKLMRGCRFVFYCQDIYPEVGDATGALKSGAMRLLVRLANRIAYRSADSIVVLGADMAGVLRHKGVAAGKIAIIPNWIDCTKVKPQAPRADLREKYAGRFVVMYAGNLGWTQNLESVLDAAWGLRNHLEIKFILVGDGARKPYLKAQAEARELGNVDFLDRVDPRRMSEVLAAGDLHLIPLGAGVAGTMVPSKVYGILAAGKPFVAMMERNAEAARLATESEVGFVVPPGDGAALASAIAHACGHRELLAAIGRRARALAESTYDRRLLTRRFADLIEAVFAGRPQLAPSEEAEAAPAREIGEAARASAE